MPLGLETHGPLRRRSRRGPLCFQWAAGGGADSASVAAMPLRTEPLIVRDEDALIERWRKCE